MSDNTGVICAYNGCMLPANNRRYLIQFIYLAISVIFLFRDSGAFTFFAVMMYVFPILLDLAASPLRGKVFKTIRYVLVAANALALVFCLSGLFGFFIDDGEAFSIVKTAMIGPGLSFSKKKLIVPMVIELLVPIILYFGSPTKKSMHVITTSGNGGQ